MRSPWNTQYLEHSSVADNISRSVRYYVHGGVVNSSLKFSIHLSLRRCTPLLTLKTIKSVIDLTNLYSPTEQPATSVVTSAGLQKRGNIAASCRGPTPGEENSVAGRWA